LAQTEFASGRVVEEDATPTQRYGASLCGLRSTAQPFHLRADTLPPSYRRPVLSVVF